MARPHETKTTYGSADIYWAHQDHPHANDWPYWLQKYGIGAGSFEKNEFGKPHLVTRELHFNRSHSGNYIAYAVSKTHEVGIDIEYLERQRNAEGILQKFFHPEQLNIFRRLDPKSAHIYFLQLWTFHEALIKLRGISAYSPSEVRELSTQIDQRLELSDAGVLLIEAPDNYIAALAIATTARTPIRSINNRRD